MKHTAIANFFLAILVVVLATVYGHLHSWLGRTLARTPKMDAVLVSEFLRSLSWISLACMALAVICIVNSVVVLKSKETPRLLRIASLAISLLALGASLVCLGV